MKGRRVHHLPFDSPWSDRYAAHKALLRANATEKKNCTRCLFVYRKRFPAEKTGCGSAPFRRQNCRAGLKSFQLNYAIQARRRITLIFLFWRGDIKVMRGRLLTPIRKSLDDWWIKHFDCKPRNQIPTSNAAQKTHEIEYRSISSPSKYVLRFCRFLIGWYPICAFRNAPVARWVQL